MSLDRQSIERRDFPIARRGYEIEAVDAHLASVADEYEEIARRGRPATGGGLASSAAEQVRMIVEAAEQSAADIERDAQLEARQLRQDAREEAERVRGDAGRQARDHVAHVAEVTRGLLDRVEAMDRELGGLLDGLRAGTQRLSADLSLLQGSVEAVRTASAGGGATEPRRDEPAGAPAAAALDGGRPAAAGAEDSHAGHEASPATAQEPLPPEPEPEPEPVGAGAMAEGEGVEPAAWEPERPAPAGERDGARMVALNMALNGVAREDTQHHLEHNFDLDDIESLLDEVYARAGR